jgi:hypothetical protein
MKGKTSITYLAYGPHALHRQVIFSILTLYYYTKRDIKNFELIIYTDNKEIFEEHLRGIRISYKILSPKFIKSSIKYNFHHRLKAVIIRDCALEYKNKLLYIDGDTYFLKSPTTLINQLSPSTSLLHKLEYTLQETGTGYDYTRLKAKKLAINYTFQIGNVISKINEDAQMWNTGVVGISKENLHLLDEILDLTDQINEKVYFILAEQFSFSYILQNNTKIESADTVIYHYWTQSKKDIFNYHIKLLLKINKALSLEEKAALAVALTKEHERNRLPLPDKTLYEKVNAHISKAKKFPKKLMWYVYDVLNHRRL